MWPRTGSMRTSVICWARAAPASRRVISVSRCILFLCIPLGFNLAGKLGVHRFGTAFCGVDENVVLFAEFPEERICARQFMGNHTFRTHHFLHYVARVRRNLLV